MADDLAVEKGWILRALGIDLDRMARWKEGGEDLDEFGLDALDVWEAARGAYDEASEEVDAQISALQAALRASDDVEMQEIAELGLNGLTTNVRVPLMAALKEAGTSDLASVAKARPKLLAAIAGFRAKLKSEPRIAACDDNPLGVPVSIRGTLGLALMQLEDALNLVADAVRAA